LRTSAAEFATIPRTRWSPPPGEVDLSYALQRQTVKISERIKTVIGRTDVDVVDIEQEKTAGAPAQPREETPFGHLIVCKSHVTGGVLEQQRTLQHFLRVMHVRADQIERLFRVRQRQQIVRIEAFQSRPAQVIGHP